MNDPDQLAFFEDVASPTAIEVPVLKVFDGDGFLTKIALCQLTDNPKDHTEFEATIRFGFVDAPELEQRGGREAREFLTALIGGRKVWIDILTKMDTGKSLDRHGRIVAVPYLGDRYPASMVSNHSLYLTGNIEIEMLLNGWAWVLERYGPDEIYFEALEVAQRNKRGIWAYEDNVHPWTFKRQKYIDRRLSAKEPKTVEKCPAEGCVGSLVKRNGKFGVFYGCSNYPNCTYSRSI
ncbi:topoisomerase DNA-binding C4 zinc finger domain-containing protein [Bradyrhizobium sp. AUGA SZCCT0169]|jgi:micrococcal nuclease|uniref:topoisomerase DNA-binding C4 zinc finger domain-containing protein n=1 Tax=Bradyrhizobium sp. AUGA SZCCT0169 TaxID=2807663 RepID=UPI001BA95ED2|nr:topoisomerase DNA-binding C4 zinc finger domain-containing protein [Bradyrhizobium sp. AUGA SZCCT0169]MBR1247797.1 topoisomerase DNA-binding C4 zinc finger domain-containing protein [Bradyrhizobium sp. AUGA SZCCT0169]